MKNSLRMRPDRIVVGEVRDSSALDMLQAMNTGHDGSLCTVHSNGPRDTLARIETMVLMAGMDLPIRAIREQVASAVDLIVHQSRLKDGSRRITHVTEVERMEGDVITLQDVFIYDHSAGFDENGKTPRPAARHRPAPEVPREARARQRARRPDALRDGRCLTDAALRPPDRASRGRCSARSPPCWLAASRWSAFPASGRRGQHRPRRDQGRHASRSSTPCREPATRRRTSTTLQVYARRQAPRGHRRAGLRRQDAVRRTAILAIDVSDSMAGQRSSPRPSRPPRSSSTRSPPTSTSAS